MKKIMTKNNSADKPAIAIDLDGVLHKYSKGYDDGTIYDGPIPGAQNALSILSKKYHIVIFSTRNHDRVIRGKAEKHQVKEMEAWLKKHKLAYDEIHTAPGKPICKLFIDDKAYRFEGNWFQTLVDVEKMKLIQ